MNQIALYIAFACGLFLLGGCSDASPNFAARSEVSAETDVLNPFPEAPLVVGGGSGGFGYPAGPTYVTVNCSPEYVREEDPIYRAAHFEFLFNQQLDAQATGASSGNATNKFLWTGNYQFHIDGKRFSIELSIDGKTRELIFGTQRFQLDSGNFFRVSVDSGPIASVTQLPIVDTLTEPAGAVRMFASFSAED